MILRMQIIATVMEPVGRKANWSANDSAGGGGGEGLLGEGNDEQLFAP